MQAGDAIALSSFLQLYKICHELVEKDDGIGKRKRRR